jgi:hypothetical protein
MLENFGHKSFEYPKSALYSISRDYINPHKDNIVYKCEICGLIYFYYVSGEFYWRYMDGNDWNASRLNWQRLTLTCEEEQIKKLLE